MFNRRPFSLIEIMIVLVLVGVIAGVSVFSLWPFLQSYRFRQEAEALYELFQELQLEAMALQSDMQVHLTKDSGTWKAISVSREPIIKSQTIDLSHVDRLDGEKEITFYASGLVHPRTLLKLSGSNDHRWLDLRRGHLMQFCEIEPQPFVFEKVKEFR